MKKLLSAIIVIISIFTLFSCENKYEPVKSTEEEAKVIATIGEGKDKYDVKYELYRTFFLNYRSEVAGQAQDAFSGDNAEANINKINEMIFDRITTVYATLSFAESIGINPYSKSFNDRISEYVRLGVEGGAEGFQGHGGDYEAYLQSLKKMNMNYSVSELLIRYDLTIAAIEDHYRGETDPILGTVDGGIEVSDQALKDFYFGDDCVRVIQIFFAEGVKTDTELEAVKADIDALSTSEAIGLYVINNSTALESDVFVERELSGMMIGRYALDSSNYKDYIDTVFPMNDGEVSKIIKTKGAAGGSYIVHKLEKSEDHFESFKDTVRSAYIDNLIGKNIEQIKSELLSQRTFTEQYSLISHKDISMD